MMNTTLLQNDHLLLKGYGMYLKWESVLSGEVSTNSKPNMDNSLDSLENQRFTGWDYSDISLKREKQYLVFKGTCYFLLNVLYYFLCYGLAAVFSSVNQTTQDIHKWLLNCLLKSQINSDNIWPKTGYLQHYCQNWKVILLIVHNTFHHSGIRANLAYSRVPGKVFWWQIKVSIPRRMLTIG